MLKGHPRALYVAFFANMGERFGFYTMMACLVFYLQASYGLKEDTAGDFYSWFYFFIYGLALVGGFIADKTKAYKGTIFVGILTMLMVIAFGNGLFKGNLQAIVGQMYDDEKYKKFRDSAFMIFYMGINIGAFFAPSAANGVRNWYMAGQGYAYDADLSKFATKFNQGLLENTTEYENLAASLGYQVTDLAAFSEEYMKVFSTGYNWAFGVAALAMLVSMIVYVAFQKMLPSKKMQDAEKKSQGAAEMPWSEEKPRLIALGLVFLVVIFFWMSFHQNGLTLSYFARDYTDFEVSRITNIFFDLKAFLSLIAAIIGFIMLFRKGLKSYARMIGAVLVVAGAGLTYFFAGTYGATNRIEPELFQQFNPVFIVFLTPVIIGFFAYLKKINKEPSTPRKIGIGMIIAALGFVVMVFSSTGLVSPNDLGGEPAPGRVSVYWLIDTYLILTVAELFLSPIGISFVSKVSPPRFQGLMQGGWLFATAIGNKLLFVGSSLWVRIELWQLWTVFVVCCLISAVFIFSIMKRLERLTEGQ